MSLQEVHTGLDLYLTRCVVLKTKIVKSSLLSWPQFHHLSAWEGTRVVVAAHISWVLLPDVCVRDGLTKTRSKWQHLYLPGHSAWREGWKVGSPQSEVHRGRDHGGGRVGLWHLPCLRPCGLGIIPRDAHHPRPGSDARRDSWSGFTPSTPGTQARTTLRGARGPRGGRLRSLPPSRVPSSLLTSRVWAARRDEVPQRLLRRAGLRVHGGAGRGSPALARPPFYPPVPSPAHRPPQRRRGPAGRERGAQGAGTRREVWEENPELTPGRWLSCGTQGQRRGRATRQPANDAARTGGGCRPLPAFLLAIGCPGQKEPRVRDSRGGSSLSSGSGESCKWSIHRFSTLTPSVQRGKNI